MGEVEQYKERLRIALKAAKICIFEVDLQKQLYTFFENAETIFGVSGEKILKDVQPFHALRPDEYRRAASDYFSHPDDEDVIQEAFTSVLSGRPATYEARMKAGGSGFVWCRIDAVPVMEDGAPSRMVGVVTDISDVKEKHDGLKKAAMTDDFTGLYKKVYAIECIDRILRTEPDETHVLAMMDIDNFKNFNDTYGHDIGDKIIVGVAGMIRETFRKSDVTGRFGGDEFIVFIRGIGDLEQIREKFGGLLRYEMWDFACTNSIGAACYPKDGKTFEELFKKADNALYQAKKIKEKLIFL